MTSIVKREIAVKTDPFKEYLKTLGFTVTHGVNLIMKEIFKSNFIKRFVAVSICACIALAGFTGCSNGSSSSASSTSADTDAKETAAETSSTSSDTVADTVVYGKIYTSNQNQEYVEAFAVKDGKYIYVGTEDGVKPYIKEGTTKILDYRDKGIVMSGATEGHGHYIAYGLFSSLNCTITGATEDEIVANVKEYVEKNPDKDVYYIYGWDNVAMISVKDKIDMKSRLDEICKDKAILLIDDSGHNAFFNSKAAEIAGITKDTEIVGGVLSKGEDGELLGLASDMASNYLLKYVVATEKIIQESDYEKIVNAMEDTLHSYGYTYYQDGWTNYFGTQFMDILREYDENIGLSAVVSGAYKIDSYDDWESELTKAEEYSKEYPTEHFKFNTIKLFADGEAVESKSGWLIEGYKDGTHGTQVWDDETMNAIVKAANEAGLSMHIHSQGDAATQQVVNAYINAESSQKGSIYNGICHGRNITEDSKKKMGEHHIYAAENINWRVLAQKGIEEKIDAMGGSSIFMVGYPIKSLIDNGVLVTSSTDVPSSSGAPTTVTGIIEVAVNDTRGDFEVIQLDESERVSVEQAMDIMTINGAKQLQIEEERGSIEVGKYADFIFIDKDISSCEKDKIHEGEVKTVYFEGKEVYAA